MFKINRKDMNFNRVKVSFCSIFSYYNSSPDAKVLDL